MSPTGKAASPSTLVFWRDGPLAAPNRVWNHGYRALRQLASAAARHAAWPLAWHDVRLVTGAHSAGRRGACSRTLALRLRRLRGGQEITKSANCLNHVDAEFFAQASDKDLDRIRITVEILFVKMFDNLASRHD